MAIGKCRDCTWRSYDVMLETARVLSVHHVITDHPELYSRLTNKKPPVLSDIQQLDLECYTNNNLVQIIQEESK